MLVRPPAATSSRWRTAIAGGRASSSPRCAAACAATAREDARCATPCRKLRRGTADRRATSRDARRAQAAARRRGEHPHAGWLNTDLHGYGHGDELVYLDVRKPFPLPDASFDLVYSEHMLEHLTYAEGQRCLRECFRVLKPGGTHPNRDTVTRTARAALRRRRRCSSATCAGRSRRSSRRSDARCPASSINNFFRSWGHHFIYDPQTLRHALAEAGFVDIEERPVGELEQHLAERAASSTSTRRSCSRPTAVSS